MKEFKSEIICGRKPVLSALKSSVTIQRMIIAETARGEVVDEIFELVRGIGIPYDVREKSSIDRLGVGNHQGVVAYVAARDYVNYERVLEVLDPESGFLLFLDQVQDPHNFGAILRSACALGVEAVIIPKRGACGLTSTVVKVAAGAVEYVSVCRVDNLQKAMLQAQQSGVWLIGLDATAEKNISTVDFSKGVGLVVGNEGKGLRRLVAERCDFLVKIPMDITRIGSLNVSVATGIALFEVMKQREK